MEIEYVVVEHDQEGNPTDLLKFNIAQVALDVAQQYTDKSPYRGLSYTVEVRYA